VRVAGSSARICRRRKPPSPRGRQSNSTAQALAERARADLARRLQTPPETISVGGIQALRAGDSLPGCTVDCAGDAPGCGYTVTLIHKGRPYTYHVSDTGVGPCPPILPG
jgi:hypothetical protein